MKMKRILIAVVVAVFISGVFLNYTKSPNSPEVNMNLSALKVANAQCENSVVCLRFQVIRQNGWQERPSGRCFLDVGGPDVFEGYEIDCIPNSSGNCHAACCQTSMEGCYVIS